jgi:uncharacterized protein (DUF433 family)
MNLPDFLVQEADGEIHMVGHRIGLYTVVRCYRQGFSAEDIAEEYPTLPLALIHGVIAFYLENRLGVDDYVEAYGAELERQASGPQKGPDLPELKRRWQTMGRGQCA